MSIFISYSSHDLAYATKIVNELRTNNKKVWYAKDSVKTGDFYAEEIDEALENSKYFILLFSRHSQLSRHVKRELSIAVDHNNIKIYVVRLEELIPVKGMRYLLKTIQSHDLFYENFDSNVSDFLNQVFFNSKLKQDKIHVQEQRFNNAENSELYRFEEKIISWYKRNNFPEWETPARSEIKDIEYFSSLFGSKVLELPKEIGMCIKIKQIDFCDNSISSLPVEIGNLTMLNRLWLANNNLNSLPKEIGDLVSLNTLRLENNNLTVLPDEICKLDKLSLLDLSHNKLILTDSQIIWIKNLINNNCNVYIDEDIFYESADRFDQINEKTNELVKQYTQILNSREGLTIALLSKIDHIHSTNLPNDPLYQKRMQYFLNTYHFLFQNDLTDEILSMCNEIVINEHATLDNIDLACSMLVEIESSVKMVIMQILYGYISMDQNIEKNSLSLFLRIANNLNVDTSNLELFVSPITV